MDAVEFDFGTGKALRPPLVQNVPRETQARFMGRRVAADPLADGSGGVVAGQVTWSRNHVDRFDASEEFRRGRLPATMGSATGIITSEHTLCYKLEIVSDA